MSDIAKKLTERREAVWSQMRALAENAVEEQRNLNSEEQGQLDAMKVELEELDKRIKSFAEADKRSQDIEKHFVNNSTGPAKKEEERSQFSQWVRESRSGDSFTLAPESRVMSATGGVAPDGAYGVLWQYAVQTSDLLQYARVINTSDGNTLPLPVATAHAALGTTATTANSPLTSSDSTLSTVNLSVAKYDFITLVPNELMQDASFDVEGYIAENAGLQAGIRISSVAAAAAIAGYTNAGVTAPTGVTTTLGNQATVGQGADLLFALYHSVLPAYRNRRGTVAWAFNDSTAATIRSLKGSTGASVWQPSMTEGNPPNIDGVPIAIVPDLDSLGVTKKPIFFGDFSSLVVRLAGGIRFERSNDYAFGNDQTAFRCIVRTGAVVVDANAVKYLVTAAS